MVLRDRLNLLSNRLSISWFDLAVIGIVLIGGMVYLHNCLYWGVGWVGDTQYGDAEFWWNGALHLAQGIFQDNPGKGFRPGYFILTGLALPVLGSQFKQFYPYFLFTFLMVSSFFYLVLRESFGRWAAAFVVPILVFNPFSAEWLATSTTDGTGLILNVAALSCLLVGVRSSLNLRWLVAFGFLFSLATLTRPLVTPFVGVVILALFVVPKVSSKRRLSGAFLVLVAFCLPTVGWMAAQKMTIDRWSLSSNDASAFYAASEPDVQVWNPTMYDHVQQVASQFYHVAPAKVDEQILNHVFWQETLKNYIKYPGYHLSRLGPHIWEIALFSPKRATHGTDSWRTAFLSLIAAGLSLCLFVRRRLFQGVLLAFLFFYIYLSPWIVTYLTLAGSFVGLLRWREGRLGVLLLSAYWLTGVAALYFVGGTWGKPSFSALFDINALGYRLGSQIFFVGDLLAAFWLVWLAEFHIKKSSSSEYDRDKIDKRSFPTVQHIFKCPIPSAGKFVVWFFGFFVAGIVIIYLVGVAVVIERSYERHYGTAKPFPALSQLNAIYKKRSGYNLVQGVSQKGSLDEAIFSNVAVKKAKADVVFTGVISPFIWNLQGQPRSEWMIYSQSQVHPLTMGPGRVFVDVPEQVLAKNWIGKQGAFVIRRLPDNFNKSNLPYYLTTPVLRAFVPVSGDGKNFELEKIIWFPLIKNATQLATEGDLRAQNANITWAMDSGKELYQRRFFIAADSKNQKLTKGKLLLNLQKTRGPTTLSFYYALGSVPEVKSTLLPNDFYEIEVNTIKKGVASREQVLLNRETIFQNEKDASLRKIELSISTGVQVVEIAFNHLAPSEGIWIYEFNLKTTDFVQ